MEHLVKQQNIFIKTIQKIHNQLQKDSALRKTKEYGETRLQTLNNAWAEFDKINTQIEVYREQNATHKYFTEKYYENIEALYETLREQLEELIREAIERSKCTETIADQSRKLRKQEALVEAMKRSMRSIEKEIAKQTSEAYFIQKIKLLNDYWEQVMFNHGEIMALGKLGKMSYIDDDIFTQIEEAYQSTLIKLQEKLGSLAKLSNLNATQQASPSESNSQAKIKLPCIDIPSFNGDYLKWQSFKDLFDELIHKNTKITDAEKLFYLKGNLTGEPLELIQHLHITNGNYQTAWDLVNKRYDNKRALVSAQLRLLFSQPELTKESAQGIKKIHDTTTECLQAIKNLGFNVNNWDPMIVYLLLQKVDKETRKIYEQTLKNPREMQPLQEFLAFLETRFHGLEAIEPVKQNLANKQEKKANDVKAHHGTIGRQACTFCKGDHRIYSCEKLMKLSPQQRNDIIRKTKLCVNCLGKGHSAAICKSWKVCKICSKKHHTLLHLNTSGINNDKEKDERVHKSQLNTKGEITTHMVDSKKQTVLLATAIIKAIGKNGTIITLRALIDQGAQATFITEEAVQRLKLQKKRINAVVTGVGQTSIKNIQTGTTITIMPRFPSTFSVTTSALILRKLTKIMPSARISAGSWQHTKELVLADPNYHQPKKVDMILGADVFGKILMEKVILGKPGTPVAQQTKLGWILSGEIENTASSQRIQCCVSEVDISKQLSKFWEIEEIGTESIMTKEDIECENHYARTHTRDISGRYIVRLPFKEDPEKAQLTGSREIALARLLQMERKFNTDKTFEVMYKDFMNEYLKLGHMVPVTTSNNKAYYLPHHAVIKEESSTTKLRVVFDGTAKRNNTNSLNDILMVGPQIQQTLITILLRWRKHKIGFTSDIEKMYRQIKIDSRDQDYQRILWRNAPNEPIQEFNLTTVTYGTAAAPFLAIRTLQQLARDNAKRYPAAEKIILYDAYVDDIVSGGDTLQEVIESSEQLISSLKEGGFNLRKWSSNSKEFLQRLPREVRDERQEVDFDNERTIKALGVLWNPTTDIFKIHINIDVDTAPTTKRGLLSESAKIFDPIGLIAPVVVSIKLIMQEICSNELNWDDELPSHIKQKWQRIKQELPKLRKIEIPRWIGYTPKAQQHELHGFADASERAYGAVIYLRSINNGIVSVRLLTAKTKVAPLKTKLTTSRLELCAASLLASLLKTTQENLEIENLSSFAWSDSKNVLSWIQEDAHRWNRYVANRVAQIQSLTDKNCWFYVKSSENPADLASRGTLPSKLRNNSLWWEGPQWLSSTTIIYPERGITKTDLERKRVAANVVTSTKKEGDLIHDMIQKYSSLGKLQRVLAYCTRFTNNLKGECNYGPLRVLEIENALKLLIKYVQAEHFSEEITILKKNQQVPKTSRLVTLNPFLDHNGIIRVGGRLENAALEYDQKHPIILPHKDELTTLIIDKAHKESLHGGNTLTLELIRQKYWILNGLKAVKGYIHKCLKCHRYKAQVSQQMMGMLPKARVAPSRPFTHTGVDYAGPFDLLLAKGRGKGAYKGYIAIFICLTTKAIHIEVVTELTSKAFIAAFKRFVGRRGPVAHLYSDNATNFVGASRVISDLHKEKNYKREVDETLKEIGTQWHFIPPSSPHFGGLWEAGVKSIKHHMRRVIGETKLTYEEMTTLMAEIEACLNSRPLCPLSEDPESLDVLTPGHFLTGSALKTVPEKARLESNSNLLDRWDRLEKMHQQFWKRWSSEYIGRLQHRPRWAQKQPNITTGNLVLIKEDVLPPSRWALGRVVETHPGQDGLTRVVTIKTRSGYIKRPITKISLLPVIDNSTLEENNVETAESEEEENNQMCGSQNKMSINTTMVRKEFTTSRKRSACPSPNSSESKRSRQEQERSRSPSRGTSRLKTWNWNYILLLSLFFVIALADDTSKPYKLTTLENREGIYFDEVSKIQFYSSEWNLLIYYNLSTYWKEFYGLKRSVRKLSTVCENDLPKNTCTSTIRQLKYQLLESEHINDILYQQNENEGSRSKRAQ